MPILDWLNKNHALKAAAGVPYRLLEAQSTKPAGVGIGAAKAD